MELIRDISINILILFGLVFIITIPRLKLDQKERSSNLLKGFLIGLLTILIMMTSWQFDSGAIFDARTVMIAITALFFPLETAVTATLIAVVYRISLGGAGVYAGSLSLLFALIIGLVWRHYVNPKLKVSRIFSLALYGVVVHVFALLAQLTFPYPQNLEVIRTVWPVFLIMFPMVTTLLGYAMYLYLERLKQEQRLVESERKYRVLVDNSKLGIFQYNTKGVIEITNRAFSDILGAPLERLVGLDMMTLPNLKIVACVEDSLRGVKTTYEGFYTSYLSGKDVPVRAQFSPIFEENHVIGGLASVEDLTDQYAHTEALERLRNTDSLTGLNNRSAFDQALFRRTALIKLPLAIAIFDVDRFQLFNTTFGYEIGNQILIKLAEVFKDVLDECPFIEIYRTGGDEFSLIAQTCDEERLLKVIQEIKTHAQAIEHKHLQLSISYGYAVIDNQDMPMIEGYNKALSHLQEHKVYQDTTLSMKTVDIIMSTLFEKSPREKEHSERVSDLCMLVVDRLELSETFRNRTRLAARLHDIGKINISGDILDKPGRLTDEEYDVIKSHPYVGYKILSSVPEYTHIANIVYAHHERCDGQGYPRGLTWEEIPLEARVIAVADAFDAMTQQRTYRDVLSQEEAYEELLKHQETQFDPVIVKALIEALKA